jgi:hypothetical protein
VPKESKERAVESATADVSLERREDSIVSAATLQQLPTSRPTRRELPRIATNGTLTRCQMRRAFFKVEENTFVFKTPLATCSVVNFFTTLALELAILGLHCAYCINICFGL